MPPSKPNTIASLKGALVCGLRTPACASSDRNAVATGILPEKWWVKGLDFGVSGAGLTI
jgi:hypothetical protein